MVGRILFVTWAGGGNVPPVLALADRLRARGHEVRAMGTASLADRFAASDIPYVARDAGGGVGSARPRTRGARRSR